MVREIIWNWFSELCGAIGIPSVGKARYFVTLYDDASDVLAVQLIQSKHETGEALKEMIVELESVAVNSARVRRIGLDNGEEFVGKYLRSCFRDSGIMPKYSPSYYTESNGMAKRINRTLLDKARDMVNPFGSDFKNL